MKMVLLAEKVECVSQFRNDRLILSDGSAVIYVYPGWKFVGNDELETRLMNSHIGRPLGWVSPSDPALLELVIRTFIDDDEKWLDGSGRRVDELKLELAKKVLEDRAVDSPDSFEGLSTHYPEVAAEFGRTMML